MEFLEGVSVGGHDWVWLYGFRLVTTPFGELIVVLVREQRPMHIALLCKLMSHSESRGRTCENLLNCLSAETWMWSQFV